MLYGILRIVFFLIIYLVALILLLNSKSKKRKMVITLVSIGFIICSALSSLLPVENLFINFKSPKSVFNYVGIGKIKDITCGKKSCMIISADKENSLKYTYSIVLKNSKGYKIGTALSYKNILKREVGSKYLEVYNVVNTDDYYVFGVFSSKDVETRISDSENTEFKNVILAEDTMQKAYMNCAYIEDIKDDYYIIFEKEKIKVEK